MYKVTFQDLVVKCCDPATPVYLYNPAAAQLEEDGGYIARMAPPTKVNLKGGVYLPEITANEYYRKCLELPRTRPAISQDILFLKEEGILQSDQDITPEILAIFTILHEEGHWLHFVNAYHLKGRTGEDYIADSELALVEVGYPKLKARYKQDHNLWVDLQALYRTSPFEQTANNHAIRRMHEIL